MGSGMSNDLFGVIGVEGTAHLGLSRRITVRGIRTSEPADHRGIALKPSPQVVGRQTSPFPCEKDQHGAGGNERPLAARGQDRAGCDRMDRRHRFKKRPECHAPWTGRQSVCWGRQTCNGFEKSLVSQDMRGHCLVKSLLMSLW
jgi:hypothetical protein